MTTRHAMIDPVRGVVLQIFDSRHKVPLPKPLRWALVEVDGDLEDLIWNGEKVVKK